MTENKSDLELLHVRSEEIDEIMGYIPRWIVRWGISVVSLTIFILLIGSWFFRYPDIVISTIMVVTKNPPVPCVSNSSGKIQSLFVQDRESVNKNSLIAIIENTANHQHIFKTKSSLLSIRSHFQSFNSFPIIMFNKNSNLGEIQPAYEIFLKTYDDYRFFIQNRYYEKKINSLEAQIQKHQLVYQRLERQNELFEEEWNISQKRFERSTLLFKDGLISANELEGIKSDFLQKEYAWEGTKASVENERLLILQLEQNIEDLKLEEREKRNKYQLDIKQTYDNLISEISLWEQRYVLMTPIDGIVTFTRFWSINQYVNTGDTVFTIVPNESSRIIGKVTLPIVGSGKVKNGQRVNIKFANYPFMEYGMVLGIVEKKSLVPDNNSYLVEVNLPNNLKTNYGIILQFQQQLQGTAEIITEDIRLLERLFQPLRNLIKKNLHT